MSLADRPSLNHARQLFNTIYEIPTLQEVLDFIDKKIFLNIELKGKNTAKPVADLIEHYILEKNWTYDHFIVSSFEDRILHISYIKFMCSQLGDLCISSSCVLHCIEYILNTSKKHNPSRICNGFSCQCLLNSPHTLFPLNYLQIPSCLSNQCTEVGKLWTSFK